MRCLACLSVIGLAACTAAPEPDPMADLKDQAINASPLKREIAASNTFYSCKPHPEPDRYDAICEACAVDLYPDKNLAFNANPDTEAPIVGVKGWATHFYHEYKPWGGDPKPRISVTGERATQKFESDDLSAPAIREVFDDMNAWCMARRGGTGEFHLLKDEIDVFVEGLPQ